MSRLLHYLPISLLKRVRHNGRLFGAYLQIPFFSKRLERHIPVLVYQMGKVGSSSVYYSLKRNCPGVVLHTHVLSHDHENPLIRRLYDWVVVKRNPLFIVSLTREPIIKNVSGFFHNYERYTGRAYRSDVSLEELKTAFLSNYVHDNVLNWFDDHIQANFEIDVFAAPFPDCGIERYSRDGIKLLVMRSELPDNQKEQAIGELLGLNRFKLRNRNIGAKKYYAEVYLEFRKKVKLPLDYINRMAQSKFYRHFYSPESIEAEVKSWSEPGS